MLNPTAPMPPLATRPDPTLPTSSSESQLSPSPSPQAKPSASSIHTTGTRFIDQTIPRA